MRIERTKGVSDRIAKPRRGVSLRPVKEEPKKIAFTMTPELAKIINSSVASANPEQAAQNLRDAFARVGTSAAATAEAMRGINTFVNPRVMGVDFASGPDSMAVAQYRTEEIPEDTREMSIDPLAGVVMEMRRDRQSDAQIAEYFAGPVPEGYTRELVREWDRRIRVVDHRPRSWRNVIIGASTGPTFPAHDFDRERYLIIPVTYEAVEQMYGNVHRYNLRYLPWNRIVGTYPEGVELAEVEMDIRDRTYQLAFRRTR